MTDATFTEAQWTEIIRLGEEDITVAALHNFAHQLDTAKRETFNAGRAALAKFEKSHQLAKEHFEACERFQKTADELHAKQIQVVNLLRKYLPSTNPAEVA
jgi:hypothetical protein